MRENRSISRSEVEEGAGKECSINQVKKLIQSHERPQMFGQILTDHQT